MYIHTCVYLEKKTHDNALIYVYVSQSQETQCKGKALAMVWKIAAPKGTVTDLPWLIPLGYPLCPVPKHVLHVLDSTM